MVERVAFPPPPDQSPFVKMPDGRLTLNALAWLTGLTTWIQRVRVHLFAVDVPSIAPSGGWWAQFTTPGAAAGDFAIAAMDPADLDLAVSAQVTAADTTTVWVRNWGAGAVDPAAGTMRIRIERSR